jgi:Cdc6-like AAA superfamily ATPase
LAFIKLLKSTWTDLAKAGSRPRAVLVAADDRPETHAPPPRTAGQGEFPRFRLSAGDQLDPRLRNRLAETRRRLRDAFTPSQPVNDRNRFAGRVSLLTDLIRAIEDERLHVVLYGQRGIGKTSMLHVLTQAASEARYRVAYVSCGAGSSLDETFRAISRSVPLLFHADYGPTSLEGERGDTFADLLGPTPVTTRGASDLMAKVTGTRLIVMLDEFDRVESAEFRRAIAEFIKNLSDRLARVQLVIAGVAENLTELLSYTPSIQRALFTVEAPPMSTAETRQLVELGEQVAGLRFEHEAVSAITDSAAGLPYLTSLLSHHAALAALDDGRLQVMRKDVAAALDRAVDELGGRLPKSMRRRIDAPEREDAPHEFATLTASVERNRRSSLYGANPGAAALAFDRMNAKGSSSRDGSEHLADSRSLDEGLAAYLWLNGARSRLMDSGIEPNSGGEGVLPAGLPTFAG